PSADFCRGAEPGRKRLRWYAEDVHHFVFALSPDYRYEGGGFGDAAVHVLYQAANAPAWGRVAVERTEAAMAWLEQLFGPYAWPQLSNVERIEPGGGTEFPMLFLDDSPDEGLILHEAGHMYVQGILANNEWRLAWLDEGFANFQRTWLYQRLGRPTSYQRSEAEILNLDLDDYSEPVGMPATAFRDYWSYYRMSYTRGELFFHQLRYIVGDDTMLRILRTYYDRWKLKHVDEAAFRAVAEEVSGRDLSAFFAQWLHTTDLYDYAVGKVETRRNGNGAAPGGGPALKGWSTRVEVVRKGPGQIPIEVAVLAERDTTVVRTDGVAEREWVEVPTDSRPRAVLLDPRVLAHDWNMLNNRHRIGFSLSTVTAYPPATEIYFHPYFSTRS
ncbi:MAG: M1 family aminopeptidase, partial [Actinomycetota bacterium]